MVACLYHELIFYHSEEAVSSVARILSPRSPYGVYLLVSRIGIDRILAR